jgi:hypothetical protein
MSFLFSPSKVDPSKPKEIQADEKGSILANPGANIAPALHLALKSALSGGSGAARGEKFLMKPVKVPVIRKFTLTSSANTAYSSSIALDPLNSSTWTNVTGIPLLFEEARCVAVDTFVHTDWSTAPAASTLSGFAFAPTSNALTSAIEALMLSQNGGIYAHGLTLNPTPYANSFNGFAHFKAKVSKQPFTELKAGPILNVGGNWMNTSDTSSIVGYVLPYIDAGGGSTVSTTTVVVRCWLECRSRA